MKDGSLDPIAIVKGGKMIAYRDFIAMAGSAIAAPGDAAKAVVDAAAKAASDTAKK
jgi:hypothetical protein